MSISFIIIAQSLILIFMGGWAYLSSDTPSITALIPVFIGGVIGSMAFKVGLSKVINYVVLAINALTILALIMPLRGALMRGDMIAVGRVGVMLCITIIAVFYLLKVVKSQKEASN